MRAQAGLASNTALTSLNLAWNELGAMGAGAIAAALRVNGSLAKLSLAGNPIDTSGGIGPEGGKAIAEAVKVNSALTKLDVSCNQ